MRPVLSSFVLLAACGGALPKTPTFVAQAGDIAIVHAHVVPMDRDGVLADHAVVVRGDRIVAVAPSDAVELPATARRIDAAGGYVLPGLADMHVHAFTPEEMTMFVAAGVTLVRNMAGIPLILELRRKIVAGEIVGPTIVTASHILDGDPPIWPMSAVVKTAAEADGVVAAQRAEGYDFLKVYARLTLEAYDAIVAAAAKHGMTFVGHVPRAVTLLHALESGQRSIEHLDGYLYAMLKDGSDPPRNQFLVQRIAWLVDHADEAKLPALVAATVKSGVWNCPTLIVNYNIAELDDAPALAGRTRWLEYVDREIVDAWDPKQDFRFKGVAAEDYARLRRANPIHDRLLKAIADAGGKLLVGTDAGNPYVVVGAALHQEIELMVHAGVPRATVLRAATAGAAEFFGQAGQFGVVAPGARADLILADTSPLAGPIAIPPVGVMLRGKWLDRAALAKSLDALRQK